MGLLDWYDTNSDRHLDFAEFDRWQLDYGGYPGQFENEDKSYSFYGSYGESASKQKRSDEFFYENYDVDFNLDFDDDDEDEDDEYDYDEVTIDSDEDKYDIDDSSEFDSELRNDNTCTSRTKCSQ